MELSKPGLPQTNPLNALLAGLMIIATAAVLQDFQSRNLFSGQSQPALNEDGCEELVDTNATLSREQVGQVLTIPERESKERIRELLAEPYCRLSNLKLRAGTEAEREAYPLEFDRDTQLVILYEDNEYAGYEFKVK